VPVGFWEVAIGVVSRFYSIGISVIDSMNAWMAGRLEAPRRTAAKMPRPK
jgi:hypothetical protein